MTQPDERGLLVRQAARARRQMRDSADRLHHLLGGDPELGWLLDYAGRVGAVADEVMTEVLRPEASGN